MNKPLLAAALLAAAVTLIHLLAGGADVATPLLASALADEPRLTLYAVWHMVSAMLAISAFILGRAALPGRSAAAAPAVRLVAVLWLASGLVFLLIAATQPGEGLLLKLPQWALLLPVGLLAWVGAARAPARQARDAA